MADDQSKPLGWYCGVPFNCSPYCLLRTTNRNYTPIHSILALYTWVIYRKWRA